MRRPLAHRTSFPEGLACSGQVLADGVGAHAEQISDLIMGQPVVVPDHDLPLLAGELG